MGRSRASDRALSHLQSAMEQCRVTGNSRLPTVRAMAAHAGVSVSLMWRTVAGLRDRGELATRQGGWIGLPDVAQEPETEAERTQKWQRVRDRLSRDVLLGRYPPGTTLPKPKELAEVYGVSYRTLRKATEALAGAQILSRYRSGYRVPFAGGWASPGHGQHGHSRMPWGRIISEAPLPWRACAPGSSCGLQGLSAMWGHLAASTPMSHKQQKKF